MNRPSWQDFAACKGRLDIFYPDYDEGRNAAAAADLQAKAICATCPVLEQCRSRGLSYPEIWGTWGGLTEKERAAMRARTRPTCGTRRGYMDHWWGHETPCDRCKAAQAAQSQAVKERAKAGRSAA